MSNIATFKSAEALTMQERHEKEIADKNDVIAKLSARVTAFKEAAEWVHSENIKLEKKLLKLQQERHKFRFNERECLALRECIIKLEDELAAWKFKYKEALRWRNEGAD